MTVMLTQEEFSKHVGTQFAVGSEGQEWDLRLAEVKGYSAELSEPKGMERFSVFFDGPPEFLLEQQIVHMRHDQMGEFEIFLVPIRGDEKGFRYEAVFNYYRDSTEQSEVIERERPK